MSSIKEKRYDDVYCHTKVSYEQPHGPIAFIYRRLKKFEITRYKAVYDLLPSEGEKLLDVGCGDGEFILMCKSKFKECYGIDVSSLRVETAKNRFKEENNIHIMQYDVDEGLPFSDQFFDVVTCIAVLEHVFNPPDVVKEINRVLKKGGFFILQVPNIAWLPHRIDLLLGKLPITDGFYMGADWEHLHWFTNSSLLELLLKTGFTIETISCSGIFAKYRRLWISAIGGDLIVKSEK
ncbi:MAG: class I SAM-dependent methyltransferase [Nitrososphaeria archaeon]